MPVGGLTRVGVSVAGAGVGVGGRGIGVSTWGTSVGVDGAGVKVGIAVGGRGVLVGTGLKVGIAVGGRGVLVGVAVEMMGVCVGLMVGVTVGVDRRARRKSFAFGTNHTLKVISKPIIPTATFQFTRHRFFGWAGVGAVASGGAWRTVKSSRRP